MGIPHQLAKHVSSHLRKVGAPLSINLFKDHGGMILLKELQVFLQDMEVGERNNHIVEVNSIVPHENIVRNTAPSYKRTHEIAA